MRKPFTPQEKQRIRKRYRGYAYLLVVVSLAVLVTWTPATGPG